MDLADIDLPEGADYYLRGPVPFMQALSSTLIDRGVPPRDIQYEVFGPGPLAGRPPGGAGARRGAGGPRA